METRVDPGNRDQAAAWNGDEGKVWVERADHYEASFAAYVPHLIETARIEPEDRVLDVGCGNGGTTCAAARAASAGHATGLDISGPMVTEARLRAAARGVVNVTFDQGDAQVHPFAPGGHDAVISKFGVMFFADPFAAFTNFARALRADGRLAFVVWRGLAENEWVSRLRDALAAGRTLPTPPPGAPGPFALADPDRTRTLLTDAGFADVAIDALDEPFVAGPDLDEAFAFAASSGLARGLLDGLDPDAREGALATLRDTLATHVSEHGVTLGSSAWSIRARRP